uniref:Ras-related protein Rab-26 n=1 Tax=Cyprinus carpio carpio TaxID=630221 RepID=A0A9J8BXV0_CYPCA
MSRKKAVKGKGGSNTPSSSPNSDKEKGKKVPAQSNGVVHPSRPSLSSSGEFYDIAFKVMLVGDSGVGKTCLLVRFKDGAFLAGSFISTVGIDFRNKVLSIDGVRVKLQIWDTAGQERFRSVTHAYYRDAHALLLLYDVTNKASFDNIKCYKPPGAALELVVCKIVCCSHITLTWYSSLPPTLPHVAPSLLLWAPGSCVVNVSLVCAAECQRR